MAATVNLSSFPFSADINCAHCYKPFTVYDPDGSEYYVCPHCNYYLHKSGKGNIMSMEQAPRPANDPLIPLGATGTINDIPYKMIAYMEKEEVGQSYAWREYMLYNYTKGYAFLAEYDGHWSLIAGEAYYPELASVEDSGSTAVSGGVEYLLFNKYTPKITGMSGEYDWDAFEERIRASELINPPYILVKEQNNRNKNVVDYYLGYYIEPAEIAEAFKIELSKFPSKVGHGANEPSRWRQRWPKVLTLSGIFAILVVLIQIALIFMKPEAELLKAHFDIEPQLTYKPDSVARVTNALVKATDSATRKRKFDSAYKAAIDSLSNQNTNYLAGGPGGNFEMKPIRSQSFEITDGPAPVDFEIYSPVDNNWFEADLELVSEKDNQTWDVGKEIDYYHGYEDGESWTDGSVNESVLLSGIPAGRYHLNIYGYSGSKFGNTLDVTATENVTLWRNVLVTLLVLSLYPLFCWFMMRRFEVNRWMNSDYTPYTNSTTEDDDE
jgi:hypothetical protein